jgi:hypothetical protein
MSAQKMRFPAPTPDEVQTPIEVIVPQLVVTMDANCVADPLEVICDDRLAVALTQPPIVARVYDATVTSVAAHAALVSLEPVVVWSEIHHAVGRTTVEPVVAR